MKFNIKSSHIIIIFVLILLFLVGKSMFITVDKGERAVIFRPYTTGLDKEHIYVDGLHIIAPWNKICIYNVKEQKRDEKLEIKDKNGLPINIDVSIRFNPIYSEIGNLHEQFGVNYINVLVIPQLRSTIRQVASRYTAEEFYSTKRSEVELAIVNETREVLKSNYIDVKAVLIQKINLPQQIQSTL
jgi:regulator of protease activity HflC (stomatin/prohibitin superfamily)